MQETVAVLGGGAWGTSVSTVLAYNGYKVLLWCLEADVVSQINQYHENNRYFPGVLLSENIVACSDIVEVVSKSKYIFEAIPVKFLRTIFEKIKDYVLKDSCFILLSKGFEKDSLLLPTQIVQSVFGDAFHHVVVSGPGFAQEVAEKQFTGVMISGSNEKKTLEIQSLLNNNYFKTILTDDIIGIQVGGALKNVCTLAHGIAQGTGCKTNTSAYIFTHGLDEIAQVCQALGGRKETIYGLAGLGDLMLSSLDTKSKNLRAGILLGKHQDFEVVRQNFATIPEGINTTHAIMQLAKKHNLNLRICKGVYDFIFNKANFSCLIGLF